MHTVRTDLAITDVSGAVLARLTRPFILLKSWGIWTLIVAALLCVAKGLPHNAMDGLVLGVSAALGSLLSVAIALAFAVLRVRKSLKPGDGVLGEHLYELREAGLYERTPVNETLSNWQGISGVTETRAYVFIEMKNGAFHILPRRAFDSDDHAASFLAEVRRHTQSSR